MTRCGGSQARNITPSRCPGPRQPWPFKGTAMISYCHGCGVYAALDDARMCDRCRATWQPSGPAPADLGTRRQPQPP